MRALGYPLQEVALVVFVAGICWTFGCALASAILQAFSNAFRRRGP